MEVVTAELGQLRGHRNKCQRDRSEAEQKPREKRQAGEHAQRECGDDYYIYGLAEQQHPYREQSSNKKAVIQSQ